MVILDEIDQIEDKDLLYDLLNLRSFSLLLIANREEGLMKGLDNRLVSRLRGWDRIHCQPNTEEQPVEILGLWCDAELETVEVEESGLIEVSTVVDGDARVAITTLRTAVRPAEQSTVNRIIQT